MRLVIISLLILYGAAVVRGQISSVTAADLILGSNSATFSDGTLLLNATGGETYAAYKNSVTLSGSNASFATFFTISSPASSANGTIAFAVVKESSSFKDLSTIKDLVVEFNTSCNGGYNDTNGDGYGGFGHRDHGFSGDGGYGYGFGFGGFGLHVLSNGTNVSPNNPSWGFGRGWYGQYTNPDQDFCTQNVSAANTLDYSVLIEYNVTLGQVSVATFSCGTGGFTRVVNFSSAIVPTGAVYVGFISHGADYNISSWNFTANLNSSTIASLALNSILNTDNSAYAPGHSKSKTGLIVGVTVAAAVVAVALVLCACCLCARRRRCRGTVHMRGVPAGTTVKAATAPPPVFHGNHFVYNAQKPPKVVDSVSERDTTPLTRNPSYASTTTGTASWLPPVVPR